jgi:hypothetical protein
VYIKDNKEREKKQEKPFISQVILTDEAVTRKPPEEI